MKIKTNYKYKNNELKNKVVLVTGANRGFGKAVSLDLACAGATVILLGRDLASLEQSYDEIYKKNSAEPILYPLDLLGATSADYAEMASNIGKKLGRLDAIVHNAASFGVMMPLAQYHTKTWFEVIQVNINASFLISQACLPLLLKSDDSRILFISDKVGRKPKAYWGAYAVSKAALEALTTILADELETSNIKINSIDPGAMKTKQRSLTHPAQDLNTLAKPEQISPAIIYLLSKHGKNIHKKQLTIY